MGRGRGGVHQGDGAEVAVTLAIELRHRGLLSGMRCVVMLLLMLMMLMMLLMWLVLCVVVLSSVVVGLRLTGSTSAVVLMRLLTELLPLRGRLLVTGIWLLCLCWRFIE